MTDTEIRKALAETALAMTKKSKELVESPEDVRGGDLGIAIGLQAEAVKSYVVLHNTTPQGEEG